VSLPSLDLTANNTKYMFTSCKRYGGRKSQRKVANDPSKIWQSSFIREQHEHVGREKDRQNNTTN